MPRGVYERTPEMRANIGAASRGRKHSAETRAKMSAAGKGRRHSAETKAKISAAHMGHEVSEETRAKIAASSRGRKHSAETRALLSAIRTGKPMSEEAKAKMSTGRLDSDWARGVRHSLSEEGREAISAVGRRNGSCPAAAAKTSESMRLPWVYVVIDGGEIREFDTKAEAGRFYGVTGGAVSHWQKRGKCVRYLNQGTEGERRAAQSEARLAVKDYAARVAALKRGA